MSVQTAPLVRRGTVSPDGRTIELEGEEPLSPGTEVVITVERFPRGSPEAVLAMMRSEPHISHEDYVELMRLINEGRLDVDDRNPLDGIVLPDDEEDA